MQNTQEIAKKAHERAVMGVSAANYMTIINGFMEKGISLEDIKPRENVFTFSAWKALNRIVKRGEHGVKISTWIDTVDKDGKPAKYPKSTTVFHISQTEALQESV